MRSNLLSSFAAGMFISTAICGAVYLFDKTDGTNTYPKPNSAPKTAAAKLSPHDMMDRLTAAGYVVQTKSEYNQNINNLKNSAATNAAANTKQNPPVTKVFINVTDGMTSIDVGKVLKDANLIPDAFKFSQDIQSKGLENHLKPGTYNVDSQMSYDQLISAIFK